VDKINQIHTEIFDLLETETTTDGLFSGFKIYKVYPANESLFFPCIVMVNQPLGLGETFYGGGGIGVVNITLDLAFKEKSGFLLIDADKYSTETLVNLYEARLKLFFDKLVFSSNLSIENLTYRSEQHFPVDKNQELYGVSFIINVGYLDEGIGEETNLI
jgi:hypothetical protein